MRVHPADLSQWTNSIWIDNIEIDIHVINGAVNPHALWGLHLKVSRCTPGRITPHITKTMQGMHFGLTRVDGYFIKLGRGVVGWVG